jgi:hypothetical protein
MKPVYIEYNEWNVMVLEEGWGGFLLNQKSGAHLAHVI